MPRILSIGRLKIKNKNRKPKDRNKIKINEKKKRSCAPTLEFAWKKNKLCMLACKQRAVYGGISTNKRRERSLEV